MKYPFNKPLVIRRPLGTAADILLHSYSPSSSYLRGTPTGENVRRMLGVDPLFYLSFHIPALLFFVRRPLFSPCAHISRIFSVVAAFSEINIASDPLKPILSVLIILHIVQHPRKSFILFHSLIFSCPFMHDPCLYFLQTESISSRILHIKIF